jgi:hypothetical protein
MKIAFLPPLPVFATGHQEVAELYVPEDLTEADILKMLNRVSGDFQFVKVKGASHAPTLAKDVKWVDYQFIPATQPFDWEAVKELIEENEFIGADKGGKLSMTIDFSNQGQERFARIYRLLDPPRARTRYLSRMAITFKSDLTGSNR